MNPSHKQKPGQELEAPDWYLKAYEDCLTYGIGIVAIKHSEEGTVHVPVAKYPDLWEDLKHTYENHLKYTNPSQTK